MIWGLVIYILGVLVSLWLSYRFSEPKCSIFYLVSEIMFSLSSWIYVFVTLLFEFGGKEIQIKKNNKSNKLKV